MSVRDTQPQFGLEELRDPRVVVFQSRDDYEKKTGRKAPAYNPDTPNKYWSFADAPLGKSVSFQVAQVVDGKPEIFSMTMPTSLALSVNIPSGEANAEERYSSETWDPPITSLRANEYLALGFAGLIVVRNKALFDKPANTFEQTVIDLLNEIKAAVSPKVEIAASRSAEATVTKILKKG